MKNLNARDYLLQHLHPQLRACGVPARILPGLDAVVLAPATPQHSARALCAYQGQLTAARVYRFDDGVEQLGTYSPVRCAPDEAVEFFAGNYAALGKLHATREHQLAKQLTKATCVRVWPLWNADKGATYLSMELGGARACLWFDGDELVARGRVGEHRCSQHRGPTEMAQGLLSLALADALLVSACLLGAR